MSKVIEEKIITELKKFSLKRNSIGYEYLIEAIKIVSVNKLAIKDFKKYVYLPIAKEYETKADNVFWCIDKLINLMCLNTNEDIIEDYFLTSENEKITTKMFIIGVAKQINN